MTKRHEGLSATTIGRGYSFRDDLAVEPTDLCHACVTRAVLSLVRANYFTLYHCESFCIFSFVDNTYPVCVT